ncbi:hypothetical protein DPMN_168204 [Dreissena polymorpha]|uniref:Uncharacterized protein n=1 Tax=Dreissena polymorpha TaxID=45954 RepID=A0A9D4IX07_DREPO|nr:hypothetical protein DPMN_168204 [Dreissena polymorpha]
MPEESRYSYGTSVNWRSARTPPAFTGAPWGHYRRQPGLNWGVAIALLASDAGIALLSASKVMVYRGSAGTMPAFIRGSIRALPEATGTLPRLHQDKP